MPPLNELTGPVQLLVEGRDQRLFFEALLGYMCLGNIQIQDFGGVSELGPFVRTLRILPRFGSLVSTVAIVRDAETNPASAFQSARAALEGAGLPSPAHPFVVASGSPWTAVAILPDADHAGMIETLCLRAVADDLALICSDVYLTCVQSRARRIPRNLEKARAQVFLASLDNSGYSVGYAARSNCWPWEDQAFGQIRQFLQQLISS